MPKPVDSRKIRDKHSRAVIADRIGNDPIKLDHPMTSPTSDYARALAGNYRDQKTQKKLPRGWEDIEPGRKDR